MSRIGIRNKIGISNIDVYGTGRKLIGEEDGKDITILGYWSKDSQGKKKIYQEKLGEIVYYNIKTTNISNGTVYLKLYDEDDPLPDDDMNYSTSVRITNNFGNVKVFLNEDWAKDIKEDGTIYDAHIDLYFDATYNNKTYELDDAVLLVSYSNQDVYYRNPTDQYYLTELYTNLGEVILFGIGETKDLIIEKMDDLRLFIAARTLETGKLVTSKKQIVYNKKRIYNYNVNTNNGRGVNIKKGANFGWKGNTTKGLSQIDYFSHKGIGNSVIKLGQRVLEVFDLFDLVKMMRGQKGSLPILGPLGFVTEFLAENVAADMDEIFDEVSQVQFEQSKVGGLKEIDLFLRTNAGKSKFRKREISTSTLNKLLKRQIKKFDDIKEVSYYDKDKHTLIYSLGVNVYSGFDLFVIECIFISENFTK